MRSRSDTLPCRADHPLHQAVPSADLCICLPSAKAGIRAPARSTTNGQAARRRQFASLPWPISSRTFRRSVRTICSAATTTPKARASQAHPEFADVSRIIVNRKQNAATDAAALIIPAVGNNKLRHETLQRFMLANDSVTVAILGWKLEPAFDAVKTPKSRACRSETGL
jgi:hypothetical protein